MKDLINEIKNGEHIGEEFYICDIKYEGDPFKKFIRNVPPQKVFVRSNDELPNNKRIYYSSTHFVKSKKNGEPGTQVIALFDNTGYRSKTGTPLQVFKTMEEAKKMYYSQRKVIEAAMEDYITKYKSKLYLFREGD